jgi:hypothetical protein
MCGSLRFAKAARFGRRQLTYWALSARSWLPDSAWRSARIPDPARALTRNAWGAGFSFVDAPDLGSWKQ